MNKIRIKNFGPIKEGYTEKNGWMDINKVTVFIGNQGSGKSTVAKLISTFSWIEKAIYRGDLDSSLSQIEIENILKFQKIDKYVNKNTVIEYEGEALKIRFTKDNRPPHFERLIETGFKVPQIIYIPAERNFLTTVKNPNGIKGLPETLKSFAVEYRYAQERFGNKELDVYIGDVKYKYNTGNDTTYIIGKDYQLEITDVASGYQSYIPMYIVSKFLFENIEQGIRMMDVDQQIRRGKEKDDILLNKTFSSDEIVKAIQLIDEKYKNSYFVNIVEEPELNLFPDSQWEMLKRLLYFNGKIDENKLILTTHSPYIINYLSLAVEAASLKKRITDKKLMDKLNVIVPLTSTVDAKDLVIYQMNEDKGTINKLGDYDGIPVDTNFLNNSLAKGNRMFDALLELEQEL